MFVFVPQPPPSRRAEKLGQQLADVLGEALRGDPNMSARDVDQAMRIARASTPGLTGVANARILALVVGLLVLFAGLGFFLIQRGGGLEGLTGQPLILGIVALLGILAVAFAVLRR